MWYSRVGSSKIQCGVNLLHQRNGENSNSSLFRILANEVDKQATYFQAERYQLDPPFCRKKFNFFHKLIKLELLDRIGKRERQRTQQMYINKRSWQGKKKRAMWMWRHNIVSLCFSVPYICPDSFIYVHLLCSMSFPFSNSIQ